MLIKIIITAISVIVGFRVIYYVNRNLNYSVRIKDKVSYSLPLVELLVWVALIIFYLKDILTTKNYFALITFGILFIIMVVPVFLFVRDFLTGFYLKLQNKINTGTTIEVDGIEGKIGATGNFSLSMVDQQGNIRSIPYHKIGSKIITKQGYNPNLEKVKLNFNLTEQENMNHTIEALKKSILKTPWVAVSQPIIAENIVRENGKCKIDVVVYVLQKTMPFIFNEK